jgi:type II secretory pathway component PulF
MNRKGQTALYGLFVLVLFGLVFFGGLASVVSDFGEGMVSKGELTGLQSFFFANLNLVITFFYILALLTIGRLGFG